MQTIEKTELTYITEPDNSEIEVNVLSIDMDERGVSVTLDRTPFYPQGGGQPSDVGVIAGEGWSFSVSRALLLEGVVRHYGTPVAGEPARGPAHAAIDPAARALHARLHSGGHLLMSAMYELTQMRAVKGYHFPDGPYVEFDGVLEEPARAGILEALQRRLSEMTAADEAITTELTTPAKLREEGVFMPMEIPAGKPTRVVTTFGYRSPCGGTHVARSGELAGLRVKKLKSRQGRTRVAYELVD
jgi:Ser-tRNA(Ala) deacylase AlaX